LDAEDDEPVADGFAGVSRLNLKSMAAANFLIFSFSFQEASVMLAVAPDTVGRGWAVFPDNEIDANPDANDDNPFPLGAFIVGTDVKDGTGAVLFVAR
jgi:hypothetical protein